MASRPDGDPRRPGYKRIPVGIPHMHYGRLGDTPMLSDDQGTYKSVSDDAQPKDGTARVDQVEGGTVL